MSLNSRLDSPSRVWHNTTLVKGSQAEKLYTPVREFLDTSDTVWYTLSIAKVYKIL